MKSYIKYSTIIFSILLILSCTNIEELQNDPNRTIEVTPDLILTKLCINAFSNVSLDAALASRQMANIDSNTDSQYYTWNRASFNNYDNLREVVLMRKEAERVGDTHYLFLADFFEVYFIVNTTSFFGDIPYAEALKLTEGISQPIYDTQKEIFLKVLDKLKEASVNLPSSGIRFKGDIIYDGNPLKWKKLINSFYLKILLQLSKHTDDEDLDIEGRFNEVFSNRTLYPLIENNTESGQLKFLDIVENRFPLFNSNSLQTAYTMEKTFIDKMKNLKDPRLFEVAQKMSSADDLSKTDFNAYQGVLGSGLLSDNQSQNTNGNSSRINENYFLNPINKPSFIISYAELNFILSEAIVRGWVPGNAQDYYHKGIEASFIYYEVSDKVSTFLSNSDVNLVVGREIQQILDQKHIATFLNSGWVSFFDFLRTGYPVLDVSGAGTSGVSVPRRFMYPNGESIDNSVNLSDAIKRQFSSGDKIDEGTWLYQ
jgi:hypothetical protein